MHGVRILKPPNLSKRQEKEILNTPVYKSIGLTRREYYNQDIMKTQERRFVRKFTFRGERIMWIKRDSKVAPGGIGYLPTNDFVWKGIEWELKSTTAKRIKERTVIRRINESVDSGKNNICIDLGKNTVTPKLLKRLIQYNVSRVKDRKRHIENIIVFDREGLYKVELE